MNFLKVTYIILFLIVSISGCNNKKMKSNDIIKKEIPQPPIYNELKAVKYFNMSTSECSGMPIVNKNGKFSLVCKNKLLRFDSEGNNDLKIDLPAVTEKNGIGLEDGGVLISQLYDSLSVKYSYVDKDGGLTDLTDISSIAKLESNNYLFKDNKLFISNRSTLTIFDLSSGRPKHLADISGDFNLYFKYFSDSSIATVNRTSVLFYNFEGKQINTYQIKGDANNYYIKVLENNTFALIPSSIPSRMINKNIILIDNLGNYIGEIEVKNAVDLSVFGMKDGIAVYDSNYNGHGTVKLYSNLVLKKEININNATNHKYIDVHDGVLVSQFGNEIRIDNVLNTEPLYKFGSYDQIQIKPISKGGFFLLGGSILVRFNEKGESVWSNRQDFTDVYPDFFCETQDSKFIFFKFRRYDNDQILILSDDNTFKIQEVEKSWVYPLTKINNGYLSYTKEKIYKLDKDLNIIKSFTIPFMLLNNSFVSELNDNNFIVTNNSYSFTNFFLFNIKEDTTFKFASSTLLPLGEKRILGVSSNTAVFYNEKLDQISEVKDETFEIDKEAKILFSHIKKTDNNTNESYYDLKKYDSNGAVVTNVNITRSTLESIMSIKSLKEDLFAVYGRSTLENYRFILVKNDGNMKVLDLNKNTVSYNYGTEIFMLGKNLAMQIQDSDSKYIKIYDENFNPISDFGKVNINDYRNLKFNPDGKFIFWYSGHKSSGERYLNTLISNSEFYNLKIDCNNSGEGNDSWVYNYGKDIVFLCGDRVSIYNSKLELMRKRRFFDAQRIKISDIETKFGLSHIQVEYNDSMDFILSDFSTEINLVPDVQDKISISGISKISKYEIYSTVCDLVNFKDLSLSNSFLFNEGSTIFRLGNNIVEWINRIVNDYNDNFFVLINDSNLYVHDKNNKCHFEVRGKQ